MAILNASFVNSFATVQADDGNNFTPVPAGDYLFQIDSTELKDTKDGSGQYVKVSFSIVGPSYQGRKIFQNYNIFNKNEQAERIGRAQLKALTNAVGLDTLRDTDELIGKSLGAHVTIQPGKNGYSDSNRLSRYSPADKFAPAPVVMKPAFSGGSPMAAAPVDDGSFGAAFGMASPAATTGGFAFK